MLDGFVLSRKRENTHDGCSPQSAVGYGATFVIKINGRRLAAVSLAVKMVTDGNRIELSIELKRVCPRLVDSIGSQ